MIIKILGTGCPKCKLLEKITREAVSKLGLEADILKVEAMEDIMHYDILATPGLVIDEQLVLSGRVPEAEEIEDLLTRTYDKKDTCDSCGDEEYCCSGGCGCD